MMRALTIAAVALLATACLEAGTSNNHANGEQPKTVAAKLAQGSTLTALDYNNLALWGCNPAKDADLCHRSFTASIAVTSSDAVETRNIQPAVEPAYDCFYIYPTVDFRAGETTNHTDLGDILLPELTITAQAAPFAQVCRVFAPFYRQATIGSYSQRSSEAVQVFKNAFADVANAFETYLRTWNDGRPLVIMGHSQGAQHATYLLHHYFDGDTAATDITGSVRSSELRERLIVGLPIGFHLFAEAGQLVGGSLANIPACSAADETACVIHFRSYPEGYDNFDDTGDLFIDDQLAAEGYLHRAFADGDQVICTNPATMVVESPAAFSDQDGKPLADGDVRLLASAQFLGATANSSSERQHYQGYFSATCRLANNGIDNFLAIAARTCVADGTCGEDPVPVDGNIANGALGLHLWDFTLTAGDLVEQVRQRAQAYLALHYSSSR